VGTTLSERGERTGASRLGVAATILAATALVLLALSGPVARGVIELLRAEEQATQPAQQTVAERAMGGFSLGVARGAVMASVLVCQLGAALLCLCAGLAMGLAGALQRRRRRTWGIVGLIASLLLLAGLPLVRVSVDVFVP